MTEGNSEIGATFNEVHPMKARVISWTLLAFDISGAVFSKVQFSKVPTISVTLVGMTGALSSDVQSWKVRLMFVTLRVFDRSGAETRDVQPSNAMLKSVTASWIAGALVSEVHP